MNDHDPERTVVLHKKPISSSEAKSSKVINRAIRDGADVETTKKFAAGTNKQHSTGSDTAKLDRETEVLAHDHVPLSVGRAIAQGRAQKNPPMTQKALATAINEKPQIVAEYESGKAIPNNQILSKLERTLGIKLRGKDIGAPLSKKK